MQWQLCLLPLDFCDFTALLLPEAYALVSEHTLLSLSLQVQLKAVPTG